MYDLYKYDLYKNAECDEVSIDRVGASPDSQFTITGQAALDFWSQIEPLAVDAAKKDTLSECENWK